MSAFGMMQDEYENEIISLKNMNEVLKENLLAQMKLTSSLYQRIDEATEIINDLRLKLYNQLDQKKSEITN